MKKFAGFILLVCALFTTAGTTWARVPVDAEHFPDDGFRHYVLTHFYLDSQGGLDDSTLASPRMMKLSNVGWDLTGIEYFTGLKWLACYSYWGEKFPDLSKNVNLEFLECYSSKLTKLDVSKNTKLVELYCGGNLLGVLNVDSNTKLEKLDCGGNNLSYLNLSNNKMLSYLSCGDNHLSSLNLNGLTNLSQLLCATNELNELSLRSNVSLQRVHVKNNNLSNLDTSNNRELTQLVCNTNRLKKLDLRNNLKLESLHCFNNNLSELDLSNNTNLKEVYCDNQIIYGLKVAYINGRYQVNLGDYVSNLANIESIVGYDENRAVELFSYDASSGIAVFVSLPSKVVYSYQTHSPNNTLMYVSIVKEDEEEPAPNLKVEALERGVQRGEELICGIQPDCYTEGVRSVKIDEQYVSKCDYGTYGKLGFVADGNSRLILRVQSDKPGHIAFTLEDQDIGVELESLMRRSKLDFGSSLETCEVSDGVFQASAVLIAPESFPESKNFPSDTFKVTVDFTGDDGTTATKTVSLTIEAAPVLLIPGILEPVGKTFGYDNGNGVRGKLVKAGFDIYPWNYNSSWGPSEILAKDFNPMFLTLSAVLDNYISKGIVCTKADIVAHGMGGLMARKFLAESGKDESDGNNWTVHSYKQGMVRRVITIATPHKGTPWANFMLGDNSVLMNLKEMTIFEIAGQWYYRAVRTAALSLGGLVGLKPKSAFRDMTTDSELVNSAYPANVPMHAICGDVSQFLDCVIQAADVISFATNIFKIADLVKGWNALKAGIQTAMKEELKNMEELKEFVAFATDSGSEVYSLFEDSFPIPANIVKSVFQVISFVLSLGNPLPTLITEAIKMPFVFLNTSLFRDEPHDFCVSVESARGGFLVGGIRQGLEYPV